MGVAKALLGDKAGNTINTDEKYIGVLQNLTLDDETLEHRQNIGTLIIEDKLVYYRGTSFPGNWKSGNCFILTLENMMGKIIKNKLVVGRSSLILCSIENLMSTFEEMHEMTTHGKEIPHKLWISALSNSYQSFANFSNLHMIFKMSSDGNDDKIECINLVETVNNLSNVLSMSATNHEFDVDLSLEACIPDKLYGNVQKIKQILSILLICAYKEAKANFPSFCEAKFLKIDVCKTTLNKRYIAGVNIGIPKTGNLNVEILDKIFKNRLYGSDFYVKFKEELQKYDLGLFIIGFLTFQCEITIKLFDSEKHVIVELEIPLSFTNENEYANRNANSNFNMIQVEGSGSSLFIQPNMNVSPISGDPGNESSSGLTPRLMADKPLIPQESHKEAIKIPFSGKNLSTKYKLNSKSAILNSNSKDFGKKISKISLITPNSNNDFAMSQGNLMTVNNK